jgi:hypothetical protein
MAAKIEAHCCSAMERLDQDKTLAAPLKSPPIAGAGSVEGKPDEFKGHGGQPSS